MIEPSHLARLLIYDKESGSLTWLPRPRDMFKNDQSFGAWNTKYAGSKAFTAKQSAGYHHGSIYGNHYLAHRVAWALETGEWPKDQIDHISGDQSDNAWANLREVSVGENLRNRAISSNNKTGYVGVFWNAANRKWRADICKDGKRFRLGEFSIKSDAISARDTAERDLGFHPNHGRSA
jgi:hypothetical protein